MDGIEDYRAVLDRRAGDGAVRADDVKTEVDTVVELEGKNVVVAGLAASGLAVAEFLAARGARVVAVDLKPLAELKGAEEALARLGVPFRSQTAEAFEGADAIVISPGVPADIEELEAARRRGIPVIGEVELAGQFLAGNPIGEPTGFSIGVGANPGAINMDEELRRLDWKIEAGAEYIITQPVFDLRILERFMKRIAHIKQPLLCGIWPLVSYRNAEFMNNEVPGASVPPEIMERMRRTTTKEEGFAEGVAIARDTFEQVRGEVAGVQLSAPMGRIDGIFSILGGELS